MTSIYHANDNDGEAFEKFLGIDAVRLLDFMCERVASLPAGQELAEARYALLTLCEFVSEAHELHGLDARYWCLKDTAAEYAA